MSTDAFLVTMTTVMMMKMMMMMIIGQRIWQSVCARGLECIVPFSCSGDMTNGNIMVAVAVTSL